MKGSRAVDPRPLNATERLASALQREAAGLTHAIESAATWARAFDQSREAA